MRSQARFHMSHRNSLVKSGKGLILGPRSFAEYFGVAAVPIIPKTEASLQFICLKDRAERKEIREFREYLTGLRQ